MKPYRLTRKKKAPRYMEEVYFLALKYKRITERKIPRRDRNNSI